MAAVEAWIGTYPPPTPVPVTGSVYGSGLMGDSRANLQVGWTNRKQISYRFRSRGGDAISVRVQERGGPVYSGGNGGMIKATLQKDNGQGQPDGTPLATVTWSPGNPKNADGSLQHWEVWTNHWFTAPAALAKDGLYHLRFENVAADPVANYISLNGLFHFGSTPSPRTAAFSDDFAFMYGPPFVVQVAYVPIFDLAYADGGHDGQAYIGTLADKYGLVNGSAKMVREKFTVSGGNRQIQKAHVRVKRISGSGDLVLTLEKQDGTLLAQGRVAASAIPVGRCRRDPSRATPGRTSRSPRPSRSPTARPTPCASRPTPPRPTRWCPSRRARPRAQLEALHRRRSPADDRRRRELGQPRPLLGDRSPVLARGDVVSAAVPGHLDPADAALFALIAITLVARGRPADAAARSASRQGARP